MPSTSELVDCDLWGYKPAYGDLAPYLSESWRSWLRLEEKVEPGVAIRLPESQYFVAGTALAGARTVDDAVAGVRSYLDASGVATAIFNPGAAGSVSGISGALLAADVARAVNEWTVDRWLGADERLRGSIVVSAREPARAAAEIRRAGADPRMVQVLLAYPQQLLGHRVLQPIHEAAAELGLPVTLLAGGDFAGGNGGVTALGRPGGSLLEGLLAWEAGGQPHLVNLLASGLLDRFPDLRIVLSGFGVAWLPSLLWRLDREVREQRIALPAPLTRRPSEIVAERVRLATSTRELPDPSADLVDAGLVLHASGPRRDLDADPAAAWPAVAAATARAFFPRLAAR